MKHRIKNMRGCLLGVVLISSLGITGVSFAQSELKHELSVGPYVSYIQYKEPGIMEETGFMAGGFADYSARFDQGLVLGADATLAGGQVDYTSDSTGDIDDINDFLGEIRGSVGYDFFFKDQAHRVTPYLGVGYRYLFDELGGTVSTTGALGYDRESQYLYIPIGVKTRCELNSDWRVGLNVEYDIFIDGTQKSELGDAISGVDTLENDQDKGFGVRGSIKLVKAAKDLDFFVEPFVRYWNIKESDTQSVSFGGTPIGVVGYEPKNSSFESGARVGVEF